MPTTAVDSWTPSWAYVNRAGEAVSGAQLSSRSTATCTGSTSSRNPEAWNPPINLAGRGAESLGTFSRESVRIDDTSEHSCEAGSDTDHRLQDGDVGRGRSATHRAHRSVMRDPDYSVLNHSQTIR